MFAFSLSLCPSLRSQGWLVAMILLCGAGRTPAQDNSVTPAPQSTTPSTAQAILEKASDALEQVAAEPESAFLGDPIRKLQSDAILQGSAPWGYWGSDSSKYSSWTSHSNRLIPIYTFGITLENIRNAGSVYTSADKLTKLFGTVPTNTLQTSADYLDQTDVYQLQLEAVRVGKKNIILVVFDGMDWQSTRSAAIYATGKNQYDSGRGTGLAFQDYRGAPTDFGFFVTAPHRGDIDIDPNAQLVLNPTAPATSGYDPQMGGATPWDKPPSQDYLIGQDRNLPHTVTDSASSATSLTAGIKTYNNAINVSATGQQVETIAHQLQREQGFAIGVVTSVPISHATPASAYAHNVTRNDYQDLTRDLLGLPSISHRQSPLPGVDVLIGAGWNADSDKDAKQGENYIPGNKYLAAADLQKIDVAQGGNYVVAQRTPGKSGIEVLSSATDQAIAQSHRLLGFFGVKGGHLPFRTADGRFDPTIDVGGREIYTPEDVQENPTLAQMTEQALRVLEKDEQGFWLMVEAGDVDWANHANNVDNSIGAVLSGDAAFQSIVNWVDARNAWDTTAVILTADHGHYFNLVQPAVLTGKSPELTPPSTTGPTPP